MEKETLLEIEKSDLSPPQQDLWEKGKKTFNLGQYPYASGIFSSILEEVPGFLEARKLLRECSIKMNGEAKISFAKPWVRVKIESQAKKDIAKAFVLLEKELKKCPLHPDWNFLLAKIAFQNGLRQTGFFSLELIRKNHPSHSVALHFLAESYVEIGNYYEASLIYAGIEKNHPSDMKASRLSKDYAAKDSMKKQDWENADGIRNLLRDNKETQDLEEFSKQGLSTNQIQKRLIVLAEEYKQDNQNLEIIREIIALYEKLEDWENAVSFAEYASSLAPQDFTLKEKFDSLQVKNYQAELQKIEEKISQNAEENKKAPLLLEKEQIYSLLKKKYKSFIENNPTNPEYQCNYAEILYNLGEYDEAITHLQKISSNARTRLKVASLLSQIFEIKGIYDLSIKQLEKALEEVGEMNSLGKDILYRKSILYEKVGNFEKALKGFKKIYEADHLYKDVGKRVEKN